jgi:hypothetical protein
VFSGKRSRAPVASGLVTSGDVDAGATVYAYATSWSGPGLPIRGGPAADHTAQKQSGGRARHREWAGRASRCPPAARRGLLPRHGPIDKPRTGCTRAQASSTQASHSTPPSSRSPMRCPLRSGKLCSHLPPARGPPFRAAAPQPSCNRLPVCSALHAQSAITSLTNTPMVFPVAPSAELLLH